MTQNGQPQDRKVQEIPLSNLLLDAENPRFAGALRENAGQKDIVNYIAETFGLSDLLSSMSQGGFHRSSPLVGIKRNSKTVIVEGNRRLASALLLVEDQRATSQAQRARNYLPISDIIRRKFTTLPVLIVTNREEVLPYLGIAHIVGNKKWDSFAKAAWAAKVANTEVYPGGLREIAAEIGDKHHTLERMVQAYRLVAQLEESGRFSPDNAIKKGRGTAKYPFSWVYTALAFTSIKDWIGVGQEDADTMQKGSSEIITTPEQLGRASDLLIWLFGDQERRRQPALSDSRQISELAAAVTDDRVLSHLRQGKSLDDAQEAVQPTHDKLMDGLVQAKESLERVLGVLGTSIDEVSERQLRSLEGEARRTRRAAIQAHKILHGRIDDSEDD